VVHLGFVGVGRNRLKFGRSGGFPCLSHHGFWIRQIRFSVFLAKFRSVEIVVAWPLAQFNSCMDPTACEGILFGYFRHGGSPRLVVAFVFALLLKDQVLIRSGQLGSLALWGVWQLAQQIGGWVQAGPFLQVEMVQG